MRGLLSVGFALSLTGCVAITTPDRLAYDAAASDRALVVFADGVAPGGWRPQTFTLVPVSLTDGETTGRPVPHLTITPGAMLFDAENRASGITHRFVPPGDYALPKVIDVSTSGALIRERCAIDEAPVLRFEAGRITVVTPVHLIDWMRYGDDYDASRTDAAVGEARALFDQYPEVSGEVVVAGPVARVDFEAEPGLGIMRPACVPEGRFAILDE